jgi:hypothetical protein
MSRTALKQLSENDQIIAERQRIIQSRPVHGSEEHYKGQRERNFKINEEIQKAYAEKRLYQIDVEASLELRAVIKSDSHFRGMLVEQLVMNYLLKEDTTFEKMPQFSTDVFDNGRDIIVGDRNIECKGETPVFIGNGVGFPLNQKKKMLSVDDLFVAIYGSQDGEVNWMCGVIWHFEPKTMPEDQWLDYPIGVPGQPIEKFGHGMGTARDAHTPYAKPVAVIPRLINDALISASGSLYKKDANFKKNFKGNIIPWTAFVRNQRRKHGRV